MQYIELQHQTDFDGWRNAARALASNDIAPNDVTWSVAGHAPELFQACELSPANSADHFNVPAAFVAVAQSAILNRDPERFSLLYRLLWRVRGNRDVIEAETDHDVARVRGLAKDVHRDQHKMKAFVRFREFGKGKETRFVAWFEPFHHIVEASAPFFERRFADMPWSILTPDLCAHWNGHKTVFTPGATKSDAPNSDPLEATWRIYYANIFNPARLKIKAMQAEMPKKYWRNLPEASLIGPLIAKAARTAHDMIASDPPEPRPSRQRRENLEMTPSHAGNLQTIRAAAEGCRDCHLWKDATQTVFGEGAAHASAMFVGEQPGDKEDLAGKPFVGPAGQVLDRALKEAGIERGKIYITNAVKHFKFVPRGKIRLHQKPNTPEIKACRQWYERELAAIQPKLVVAMGATAAQSVFGKITQIGKNRGRLIDLAENTKALVTVHPSYLLRLPDEEARLREYQQFVSDLKLAATYLHEVSMFGS